ncbi:DCP2-domain-containing protein, partial [Aureobasidium melanogenum]
MQQSKMQLVDWLDDLCVRFIINLPQEELESVARICFQVEEAQWFYEDFIRPTDPSLPSLNLRDFCLRIFQHCPLLSTFSDSQHTAAYQEFLAYKTRVPVRGAILLNHDMDQVVLVKGWKKSATWSFPRGKINKDEPDLDCAIREVWEETGYDIAAAGLASDDQKYIDVTMREQHLRMFVFRGVPLDTHFEPKTRKEISKIAWYRLTDLPSYTNKRQNNRVISHQQDANADQGAVSANKLYMVAPFLPPLKKWINQQKKRDAARQAQVESVVEEALDVPSDSPAAEAPAANAASELKRLLSVNVPGQDSPQTANGEGNQANALLAMLRGNLTGGLAPPADNDLPPVTPLDQVTSTPPEPGTPHYQHHQPSPAVRQQPPPGFPFPSPAHQRNVSLHPPGFFGQSAHENLQRVVPDMSHMSQQPPHAVHHIHPQGPHPSMQQQLFPGGHPAPIAHGPVAPSASQLPAPRLNNHAMNLLSAFKAPSQSPVGQNSMPYGNGSMSFPSPNQNHMQAHQQQQLTGNAQHARRRSEHQNSLLGLFKSPNPPRAAPVSQSPQATLPFHTAQNPASTAPPTTAPTPQQRNASLAMLTRTLPKAKPTPPPAQTKVDMFPAKQAVQEVQAAQNRAAPEAPSRPSAPDAPRAPVSILPRPGSAANRGAPAPPSSDSIQTPHKLRRGNKNESPANFTILQRPSPRADHNGSPEMPQARQAPPPKQPTPKQAAPRQSAPKQAQEVPKQFQPQILQRPKAEKSGSTPGAEQPMQNTGEQRNALLALFAKQNPGLSQAESRSGSAMSNNSGAPLPSDPSLFRSRLASASSVLSNGGDNDGLKSPSTPVEAKGFLLDYLNGVVKSEKNKGPKRGPV